MMRMVVAENKFIKTFIKILIEAKNVWFSKIYQGSCCLRSASCIRF